MTATTQQNPGGPSGSRIGPPPGRSSHQTQPAGDWLGIKGRRLPGWAHAACAGGGLAVGLGVGFLTGEPTVGGVLVVAAIGYIAAVAIWSWRWEGDRKAKDRLMTAVVVGAFALAMIPLVSVMVTVVSKGIGHFSTYFLLHSMRGVFGGMDAGGAYHAIVGTLEITGLATVISVPIGLLAAVYLVEYGHGPLARGITFFVDVMTGIPSIVAGLFAYALFAVVFGPAFRAGIIGAVALAVLMIPVVVRSSEEMLRLVPMELREASLALGVPHWLTVLKVVVRTSVAGLVTGVMLAIARVIGETAPLLLTVGTIDSINYDPLNGRMMTLPVYVYRQYQQGTVPCSPGASNCVSTINFDRAWSAALTLILIVMALNVIARLVARFFAPKTR